MKKQILIFYLIVAHLFLVVVLLKNDFIQRVNNKFAIIPTAEITEHYRNMLHYHSRMDGNVPNQSVIFIGDSITQGLCVAAVANPSVNYGIGNDTTVGVLQRLPVYKSLKNSSAVVIAIGINDMDYRSNEEILENYKSIASHIPKNVPVIFSAILPIDEATRHGIKQTNNQRIKTLNVKLKEWAETTPGIFFVDAGQALGDKNGNLSNTFHDGDGLHLNSRGNAIWIQLLSATINNAQKRK